VPPDYDDDDIVEDYQEVSSDSARRVPSAQGGPVERPGAGSPDYEPTEAELAAAERARKGKISQKSAKRIWIICIAITVLGIGAVGIDYFLDPLGRKGPPVSGNGETADDGGGRRGNTPREQNLTPRQKLEREFMSAVVYKMKEMDASKAWDFYWLSYLEFDDSYGKAVNLKKKEGVAQEELDEGWALAIKHYYKARYASELFRNHFDQDRVSMDFLAITLDAEGVEPLTDDQLKSPKVRTYWAAYLKIDNKSTSVNLFKTDVLRYDMGATKVHESPEWAEKHFGKYKALWEGATGDAGFAQEDLDFINGPDYKAGEKKMFEEYLAKRGG
jgi:hypothetical protein